MALEKRQQNFLWEGNKEKKDHLVKWKDVCRPKEFGDIRDWSSPGEEHGVVREIAVEILCLGSQSLAIHYSQQIRCGHKWVGLFP